MGPLLVSGAALPVAGRGRVDDTGPTRRVTGDEPTPSGRRRRPSGRSRRSHPLAAVAAAPRALLVAGALADRAVDHRRAPAVIAGHAIAVALEVAVRTPEARLRSHPVTPLARHPPRSRAGLARLAGCIVRRTERRHAPTFAAQAVPEAGAIALGARGDATLLAVLAPDASALDALRRTRTIAVGAGLGALTVAAPADVFLGAHRGPPPPLAVPASLTVGRRACSGERRHRAEPRANLWSWEKRSGSRTTAPCAISCCAGHRDGFYTAEQVGQAVLDAVGSSTLTAPLALGDGHQIGTVVRPGYATTRIGSRSAT
jgi:hypothetical protein